MKSTHLTHFNQSSPSLQVSLCSSKWRLRWKWFGCSHVFLINTGLVGLWSSGVRRWMFGFLWKIMRNHVMNGFDTNSFVPSHGLSHFPFMQAVFYSEWECTLAMWLSADSWKMIPCGRCLIWDSPWRDADEFYGWWMAGSAAVSRLMWWQVWSDRVSSPSHLPSKVLWSPTRS